ncbi:MAG: DUF4258 domain-containing protein [Alphaproteobacteria bacterium]
MECNTLIFSGHALRRMFERNISPDEVRRAIETGNTIESYLDDTPYPSALILGFVINRPLHIVLGYNDTARECYIITTYWPNPDQWDGHFKVRKTP